MNSISSFLIGLGIVLIGAFAVVLYLRSHLRKILLDLCRTQERADFWAAFSNIVLILVPIIFALFPRPEGGSSTAVFFDISSQLKWGLIGLVGAVVVLGVVLSQFIPRGPIQ